jgi:tetratricopeptide (TPR) repeat protein
MPFNPAVDQELAIDGMTYRVAEHPAAPGMPYGQEGRAAVVYQLLAPDSGMGALKVFKPRFRVPALVGLSDRIASFAELPGLSVCRRTVLSARRHANLLRQYPDLTYAVLMPWVHGPTWTEVLVVRQELNPEQSLELARSLAEILVGMEEHSLAHCDLSASNVMLPLLVDSRGVALVDVEGMYGSGLERPREILSGSPGYAHKTAPEGLWGPEADRFSGAVLVAEMLGWCDERVRKASWGESYFDPYEMQRESERYDLLVTSLKQWGAEVVGLFERSWHSESLVDCATFGEWLVRLPLEVPPPPAPLTETELNKPGQGETKAGIAEAAEVAVKALMDLARQFEDQGDSSRALETYRQAQALAAGVETSLHSLAQELALIVRDLEAKQTIGLSERDDLAGLFNDGLAAFQRGDLAKARELLVKVVRQQPNYEQDGKWAGDVLAKVERRLKASWRRALGVVGGLSGLGLIILVCLATMLWGKTMGDGPAGFLFWMPTPVVTQTPTPTNTPIPADTPIPCSFTLLNPEDRMAVELPAAGRTTFEWTAQLGGASYRLEIDVPIGEVLVYETEETSHTVYNAYLLWGGYWRVVALDAGGEEMCVAGPWTLTKFVPTVTAEPPTATSRPSTLEPPTNPPPTTR